MGLYNVIKFDNSLGGSFLDDGHNWDIKMRNKYLESKLDAPSGQILSRDKMFCKNASIFDLTGTKIWWGDIFPEDVENLNGIYYILSEGKSFWDVPKKYIHNIKINQDDFSLSPFRDQMRLEPTIIDIKYIKRNALARILDGKIQTNKDIISKGF